MASKNNGFGKGKQAECIVRLKIRENDVKSQMWRLMTDNSLDSVNDVEKEISNIFDDLDLMIMELFDGVDDTEAEEPFLDK